MKIYTTDIINAAGIMALGALAIWAAIRLCS